MRQFTCARCGLLCEATNTVEEADAEARELWGADKASQDPEMASVCESCWADCLEYLDSLEEA